MTEGGRGKGGKGKWFGNSGGDVNESVNT